MELSQVDPEILEAIRRETRRQNDHIELIASENFVSRAVMEAAGSTLTNKYAEGYPGARYYGGCEFVDVAESLARERARRLFGAEHANVVPGLLADRGEPAVRSGERIPCRDEAPAGAG